MAGGFESPEGEKFLRPSGSKRQSRAVQNLIQNYTKYKGSAPEGVTWFKNQNAYYSTILHSSTEERSCSCLRTSKRIESPDTSTAVGPALSNCPFLMFLS